MLRIRPESPVARSSRAGRAMRCACLAFVLSAAGGEPLPADERPSDGRHGAVAAPEGADAADRNEPDPVAESKPGSPPPPAAQMTPEKRQGLATAGIVLLAGIACSGLLLLAVVLILGRRARRIARAPVPSCAPPDELWYLRTRQKAEEILRRPPPPRDASADDETLPA